MKAVAAVLVGAVFVPVVLFGALVVLVLRHPDVTGAGCAGPAGSVQDFREAIGARRGGSAVVAGLTAPRVQVPNARVVQRVGAALKVPPRGQVVALATAMTESGLVNKAYGDRDSLGLFQQRPSMGWGTAAQVMDPVHASTAFYRHLVKVPGWRSMAVAQAAQAAQAVQRSGRPEAYARYERLAIALQRVVAGPGSAGKENAVAPAGCADGGAGYGKAPAGALPEGYAVPADAPRRVRAAIRWALAQLGTPYQWGGTCRAPHGRDRHGWCDCSSLTQAAYGAAGVGLPRTTFAQVRAGRPVPKAHPRPGDLLFTDGPAGSPQHVGMYVGSGLVVHAPHTGDVVRVAPLSRWRPRIVAARRVVTR